MDNITAMIVRNEEDFISCVNKWFERHAFDTMEGVRNWFEKVGLSLPVEYPCVVGLSHYTVEVDDVGRGYESRWEAKYTYIGDLKEDVHKAQILLKIMEVK